MEGIDTPNYTEPWNSSLVQDAIPLTKFGKLDGCHIYSENHTKIGCDSWVYDTQYYTSSRGIEWNFVCDRRWMSAAAQCIFMAGVVLGSLVLGPLCDKFGRRTIFVWSSLFQLLSGLVVAFATDYYWFVGLRFILGMFAISPYKAGYVLTIETVGPSKRALCSALFQTLFGSGVILLGLWGYFIDNRFYLQIIFALHSAVLLPHWFLLDESPRWLWSQGRAEEAVKTVEKALRINKSSAKVNTALMVSSCEALHESLEDQATGLAGLFAGPHLIRRTIIMSGCWFAIGLVYYGLALNSGSLRGNPQLLLSLSGCVELPGYCIGMFCVHKLGHRAVMSTTMVLSGLSCIIVIFLPYNSIYNNVAAMLGRGIISGAFATVYKYSAELFPTVVRTSAVGFGTMCASVSAAVAPLITLLDTFNPTIPTVIFGLLALVFGLCTLLLPETKGKALPQSIEDGERFGVGDNCFTSCKGRRNSDKSEHNLEAKEPLKATEKK